MKKVEKWMAIFDNHGDRCEPSVIDISMQFMRDWKPKIRVHGGDCFDMRSFRTKASDEERQESVRADVEAGIDLLRQYKPTHWLRGNHDERLWDIASGKRGKDGNLRTYCSLLVDQIVDRIGDCQLFPYDAEAGVLRLGSLKVIHGYHTGVAAARHAALIYGSVLMGHVHTIDEYSIPGIEHRVGRTAGCLCQRRMDYNRAMPNTLRQRHGFTYGLLFPDGSYTAWQAREINGVWHLPTEMKEYHYGKA